MKKVEQISIFLENKAGRLSEVTRILSEAEINIRALALADTTDFGVLRLIVSDNETTANTLRDQGFTVRRTEVIAVAVPDRPGGLHHILKTLQKNDINVEYMYAFVNQSGNDAIMIFRFEDAGKAACVLAENHIRVVDGDTLYGL